MDYRPRFPSPLPGNRDLLLIAVGLVLGVLLGPAVLGRVGPQVHRDLFGGVDRVRLTQQESQARMDKARELEDTGVSPAYVEQQLRQVSAVYQARREAGRAQRFNRVAKLSASLVLALVLVMTIEAGASPQPGQSAHAVISPMVGRLVGVRYGLIALWITLMLASPVILLDLPWLFAAMVLVIGLVLGLVPLGRRKVE